MASNSHLTHLPLQAIRPNLLGIATALRAGVPDQYYDILDLRPGTACRNGVAILRYASPLFEKALLVLAPFALLGYGVYQYVSLPKPSLRI